MLHARLSWVVVQKLFAARLLRVGLVLAACALAACASVADPSSPLASVCAAGRGGLVEAHTLRGDQLQAGPVLVDHRAVWVEAGHRLVVRSLDADGCVRTIFSTSATPGAPNGALWPFFVHSIVAGGGRVAFVEEVVQCGSAPPGTQRCAPTSYGPAADSVTLFAGRPGAIRPVESVVHPDSRCGQGESPQAVGIASAGLVVNEISLSCRPARGPSLRLVLRSFSGRLVRVLARGENIQVPLVVGRWMSYVRWPSVGRWPERLQIVSLRTGQVVQQLRRNARQGGIDLVALDPSGRFALLTTGPRPRPCQPQTGFGVVSVGQIGHPGVGILAKRAVWGENEASPTIAIAGGRVAYGRPTGHCGTGNQIVVAAPGGAPRPVPGMRLGDSVAFDRRTVATAHGQTVQLAAIRN